jgi:hypothetical protein
MKAVCFLHFSTSPISYFCLDIELGFHVNSLAGKNYIRIISKLVKDAISGATVSKIRIFRDVCPV